MKGIIISKSLQELNVEPKDGMGVVFNTHKDAVSEWLVGNITDPDYKTLTKSEERFVFVKGNNINAFYPLSEIYTFKVLFKIEDNPELVEDKLYCLDYSYWYYAITRALVNTNTPVSCYIQNNIAFLIIKDVVLNIESQAATTELEHSLIYDLICVALEAGYTKVRDHWGQNAYDTYNILNAVKHFGPGESTEDKKD